MTCRAHGPVDGDTCSTPGCFEILQPCSVPPTPPADTCSSTGCGMPLPCPLHPGGTPDAGHREAMAHLAATAPTAPGPRRDTAAGAGAACGLRFPWGTVRVPAEGIAVGRDCTDDCGGEIAEYDNVSRTHARVQLDEGVLTVVDLDSMNGTTVNGVRARPTRPVPLGPGDVLGFGNRLRCTVVPAEDSP